MAFKTDEERLRSTIWMKTQKAGTTVNLATVRGVIDIVDEVEDVALDDLSQLGDDEFTFVDVVTTANPFALIEYFEGLNFPVHYLNRDLWIPGGVFDPNSEVLVN
ncbi:MAG: hypothetical protein QGH47_05705, partial [Candidatus Woesearchaeota archaeon]|nr:hypothetical protein [Candidatus Woesearchaeota archaeon]